MTIDAIFINTYSSLISGLFMIAMGVFVFSKNPWKRLNTIFFFFCSAVAVWLICTFIMYKSDSDIWRIFWDKMVYIGVVFIPMLMYHFGLVFTETEEKNKVNLYLGYFFSLVFLLLSRTSYFVNDLYRYEWGVHTQAGFAHHLFLAFFFFYVLLFLLEIYNFLKITQKKYGKIRRNQVKYLLISFITMNMAAYAFLAAYGINVNPLGAYLLEIISVSILALAITKYHLFEIRVILTEILAVIMGTILFVSPFLMPDDLLRNLAIANFLLFCFFGYYLIRATYQEEKRREDAEKLAKDAVQLSEAKDQFMLSVQHHLRTPLTAIQGYSSLLLEGSFGEINEEAKQKISRILESSRELIKLANNFLSIAKMETRKDSLLMGKVQMKAVMEEIIKELEPEKEKKKIYIKFSAKGVIPEITTDRDKIKEAIYNVVNNAIKYTQKGGITVEISLKGEENILISVKDTGIGIEKEQMKNMFRENFERGRNVKQINAEGVGIGLYLSARIIKNLKGKIWAKSEGNNKGSVFYIELPINQS